MSVRGAAGRNEHVNSSRLRDTFVVGGRVERVREPHRLGRHCGGIRQPPVDHPADLMLREATAGVVGAHRHQHGSGQAGLEVVVHHHEHYTRGVDAVSGADVCQLVVDRLGGAPSRAAQQIPPARAAALGNAGCDLCGSRSSELLGRPEASPSQRHGMQRPPAAGPVRRPLPDPRQAAVIPWLPSNLAPTRVSPRGSRPGGQEPDEPRERGAEAANRATSRPTQ